MNDETGVGVRVGATPALDPNSPLGDNAIHAVRKRSAQPEGRVGENICAHGVPYRYACKECNARGATPEPLSNRDKFERWWNSLSADLKQYASPESMAWNGWVAALRAPEPGWQEISLTEAAATVRAGMATPEPTDKLHRFYHAAVAQEYIDSGMAWFMPMHEEKELTPEAMDAARAKFGLEGGVHQTESAGEAVQRPAVEDRAEFERWAVSEGYDNLAQEGAHDDEFGLEPVYCESTIHAAWAAWRAARKGQP